MKFVAITILTFFFLPVMAQYTVRGRVVDERSRQTMAFVNIMVNDNPRLGTVTDIDGNFNFSGIRVQTLTFSFVGYERKTINLDTVRNAERMIVGLRNTGVTLSEVIIEAGENPADRIIRQVIANRRINNPENIASFRYRTHNIMRVDLVFEENFSHAFNDTAIIEADSLQRTIRRGLGGGYIMLTETVTERQFLYPSRSQETILGTRVSGFQSLSLPFSATDFQPFSFYEDHFQLLDTRFLNPISAGSLNNYFFHIEDTIFQGQDTVFVLSFRPRRGRNFDGLRGVLQINTNRFAVQNVIAEPAEEGLWGMRIQQKYQFLEDTQWFPSQLNFDIWIGIPTSVNDTNHGRVSVPTNMLMSVRSFIDSVELFPNLRGRDFAIDQVIVDENALLQDSAFWVQRRIVPLSETELATYRFMDSLGEEFGFDRIFTTVEKLFRGIIPFRIFDFDLGQTLLFNEFEGFRLGLGVSTNERLSRDFSIGGFFGYGLRDNLWKYGGNFLWNIHRRHDINLRIGYQYTLQEPGRLTPFSNLLPGQSTIDFRSYLATRMDRIERKNVDVDFRLFRYAKFNVGLNRTRVQPLYEYSFFSDFHNENVVNYHYTSLNIGLRYSHRERFSRTSTGRMSLGTRNPVFLVNYSRGIRGFLDGDFDFNKVEFRMDHSFVWRILGTSNIRVGAGFVDRPLPYGLLFTGEGSRIRSQWGLFIPNYFQTMQNYEFLSDRYTNVFLSHNFGSLFLRVGRFRPHFIVHQNMGWGRLSSPERQQNIEFLTKENGFFESGLHIDRLLRFRYFGVMYVNFGVGTYFRYGAYAFDRTQDNFAVKFSLSISTR
ncbi:MAG: DUF5686 and carboxypeptidase regulatory-like domain-containing protein [Bacteroidales bacterium]|nr:DUF5686 and carboxypeptidase regulatory-like domain-containing protein [Bacteroidales bacterium]